MWFIIFLNFYEALFFLFMFLRNRQTTYITDVPFLRKIYQDSFIHSFNECFYQSHILFPSDRYKRRGPGKPRDSFLT